jgi:phosphatidylglycerophosphatase C
MGMKRALRQPYAPTTPVIAFDFDGTLTHRDSFIAYLAWRAGAVGFCAGLATLVPALATYGRDRDRGALKAAAARRFIGGLTRAEIEADAGRFQAARFEALMRPDALACWREWGTRGARRFIVTASPELIVAPFAQALGADRLIGTRLAFDAAGRFTGALDGTNCRGPEKVRRLQAELGPEPRLLAAYGDTAGDREMLAIAETAGMRVFTGRP